MRRHARAALLALAVVVVLCSVGYLARGGGSGEADRSGDAGPVDHGDPTGVWVLRSIDRDGTTGVFTRSRIVLTITETDVHGTLLCNDVGGLRAGDDDFVDELTSTLVECGSSANDLEEEIIRNLDAATGHQVDGTTLTLTGPDVRMVLVEG